MRRTLFDSVVMSMTSNMTVERRPARRSRRRAASAAAMGNVPQAWYTSAGASSRASVCHQPRTVWGQNSHSAGPERSRRTRRLLNGRVLPGPPAEAPGDARSTAVSRPKMPLAG